MASFAGTAAMVLGVVGAVNRPSPWSGVLLVIGGLVGHPGTRAQLERVLELEISALTVTAVFLLCLLASFVVFTLS